MPCLLFPPPKIIPSWSTGLYKGQVWPENYDIYTFFFWSWAQAAHYLSSNEGDNMSLSLWKGRILSSYLKGSIWMKWPLLIQMPEPGTLAKWKTNQASVCSQETMILIFLQLFINWFEGSVSADHQPQYRFLVILLPERNPRHFTEWRTHMLGSRGCNNPMGPASTEYPTTKPPRLSQNPSNSLKVLPGPSEHLDLGPHSATF